MNLPTFATRLGWPDSEVLPRLRELELTRPCSRCAGTGHYTLSDEGSRCWKCHGKGDELPLLNRELADAVAVRAIHGDLDRYIERQRRRREAAQKIPQLLAECARIYERAVAHYPARAAKLYFDGGSGLTVRAVERMVEAEEMDPESAEVVLYALRSRLLSLYSLACSRARLMQSFLGMKTLILLSFALVVSACGARFEGGFDDLTDPQAGAAGDLPGGAGGEGATATGGSASQGGTAGTLAGTGGEPGGAPGTGGGGAGAAGSAGTATGGTGGATAPSCAPEDAIVFPESFTWNGFSTRWDDVNQSYCGHSDGGSCSFRNLTLNYTDPTHLNIYANLDCAFTGTVAGVCGSETPCDSTIDSRTGAGASFVVVPDGDGYRLTDTGMSGFGTFVEGESCRTELAPGRFWSPGGDPTVDFRTDFMAFMAAQRFACP